MKQVCMLTILMFFVSAQFAGAQFSAQELISAYEYAVKTNNVKNMAVIQKAIEKDSSALGYVMANRPDLYTHFSKIGNEGASASVLVSGEHDYSNESDGLQGDGEDVDSSTGRHSPKQRWARENLQRMGDHMSGELEERTYQMIVSGVGDDARRTLLKLLKNELGMVKFVRETHYRNSRVEYQLELKDTDLESFAYAFDNKRFGSFALDLVNLNDKQVEFLLKRN